MSSKTRKRRPTVFIKRTAHESKAAQLYNVLRTDEYFCKMREEAARSYEGRAVKLPRLLPMNMRVLARSFKLLELSESKIENFSIHINSINPHITISGTEEEKQHIQSRYDQNIIRYAYYILQVEESLIKWPIIYEQPDPTQFVK